jgi:hypothetical protein
MRKEVFLCVVSAILFLFPSFLWAGTATVHWRANSETDLKEYRVYEGTASRSYGTPVPVGKATSYTFTNLSEGLTHYFAVTAVDTSDNESGFSTEVSEFIASSDAQKPQVAITSPATGGNYTTSTSSVDLRGTATDNVGVTQVAWSRSGGGSGTATGTASWSIAGIGLSAGQNTITVTAKDAAGNQGTAIITVTYTPPSSTSSSSTDTQPPQVRIISPTTAGSYTSSRSSIHIKGTASDNVGVTQVTWSSSNGRSGTAYGSTNWSVRRIALSSGENTITVTAKDAAGNQSTAVITVIYGQSSTGDTQSPQVAITSPSAGGNYTTSTSSVDLGGTASDNVGVTQVNWSSTGGGSGTAAGTTTWSITGIRLASGDNTITVTAKDAAGNQSEAVITVTSTARRSWWQWWRR